MEPAFREDDLLLVFSLHGSPRRGSVAVVRMPSDRAPQWRLKRIVGLPGDTISYEDGLLTVNGARHTEPYLAGLPADTGLDNWLWDIDDGAVFVLGDNRAHSTDSRHVGPLDIDCVEGIVVARLWPIGRRRGTTTSRKP